MTSSSVQKSDRDRGDNAQRDEDEECYAHANRECGGKRGLTGWDSHEPREPFVEFHSMSSFRIRRTLRRARICRMRRPFSRFMISQFQFALRATIYRNSCTFCAFCAFLRLFPSYLSAFGLRPWAIDFYHFAVRRNLLSDASR